MGGDRRVKKPKTFGKGFLPAPVAPEPQSTQNLTPVFCLRYLAKDYTLSECDDEETAAFAKQLYALCQLSWQTINSSPREGLGHEKINRSQIQAKLPARVTAEIEWLLAFRFGGASRIIGSRFERVFEVYLVDPKGKAYKH